MKILLILTLFLTGCSHCAFVFDIGPGKSYCYAAEYGEKLCKDKGGINYSNPVSISCKDGTLYKGHSKKWEKQ